MNEMRKLMEAAAVLFEQAQQVTDDWFRDGFKTYKKPAKEKYQIADSDGTVQTLEGPVPYKKGYYIMTGPKGEKYPMPPEKFRELKDDLGNGVAAPKKIPKVAKLADHDGSIKVSWGDGVLHYRKGQHYLVKHGPGDYGAVEKDIFAKTYHLPENSQVTEDRTDTAALSEVANELEDIYEQLKELVDSAKSIVDQNLAHDYPAYGRARYWMSALESALDDQHQWLGGSQYTLLDTIEELQHSDDELQEVSKQAHTPPQQ